MKLLIFLALLGINVWADDSIGRKLFLEKCAICHGEQGMGDGPAASGLNPRPRNLEKDPFKNGDTETVIAETLITGLGQMPSFRDLSDSDRSELAKYVESLRGKK